ncbi:MAG: sugar phosphate isomerase/epimerase, partial [Bacteroidota bacterium]
LRSSCDSVFSSPSCLVIGADGSSSVVLAAEAACLISGHLWVYASNFPPNWDCTPILESVFADFQYAGLYGVELMEGQLRHGDAVKRIKGYIKKYNVKVSGSSYGVGFNMWDITEHKAILEDLKVVLPRLADIGGKTFGISVGHKKEGLKTASELDAQAELLLKIRRQCEAFGIEANLHNHTYEVENDMHDLKGTLARIPDFKLGPDINWLVRAGVNPVEFIKTYGKQIVYLHIRDQYQDGSWTEYVGQGATNFMAIAKALQETNFEGSAAIELAFPNDFEPEYPLRDTWKKSREYVQRTFGWSQL